MAGTTSNASRAPATQAIGARVKLAAGRRQVEVVFARGRLLAGCLSDEHARRVRESRGEHDSLRGLAVGAEERRDDRVLPHCLLVANSSMSSQPLAVRNQWLVRDRPRDTCDNTQGQEVFGAQAQSVRCLSGSTAIAVED